VTDDSKLVVPAALPDDVSDVMVALEAAGTIWQNGDRAEALRWLKRAADAAAEAGQDSRAFELARAAADLKESLEAAPPAAHTPAPVTSAPPPAAPRLRSSEAPTAGPIRSRPPPPPSARSKPPPPPSARPSSLPAPPATTGASGTMPAQSSRPPVAEKRPSVVPARPPLARSATPMPARAIASTLPPLSSARVRVSVKSSVRDPNLLLVRLLADGQSAPPGTQEAYLTGGEASGLLQNPAQAT
jgi:hypothetical protein